MKEKLELRMTAKEWGLSWSDEMAHMSMNDVMDMSLVMSEERKLARSRGR